MDDEDIVPPNKKSPLDQHRRVDVLINPLKAVQIFLPN